MSTRGTRYTLMDIAGEHYATMVGRVWFTDDSAHPKVLRCSREYCEAVRVALLATGCHLQVVRHPCP